MNRNGETQRRIQNLNDSPQRDLFVGNVDPRSVSPYTLSILNINKNYLVINYFRQFEIIGFKLTKIGLHGVCLFLYLLRDRMDFH